MLGSGTAQWWWCLRGWAPTIPQVKLLALEASVGQLGVWPRQGMVGPTPQLSPSRGGVAASPSSSRIKSELSFTCWPALCCPLLASGWHVTSGGLEKVVSSPKRQAGGNPGLREPRGQRTPLPARKPGTSYKFNKICLINYRSSPRARFAAPGSRSWQSGAASTGERWSEFRAGAMASGPAPPPPGWPQGSGSWPVGAQGTGGGAEARP